jgi:propionyl-CoA carboxylase alpha chain
VVIMSTSPERVVFSVDGIEHHYTVARYGEKRFVDSEAGPVELTVVPRFPSTVGEEEAGSLHAPMPGKVIRVDVEVGSEVVDGEVLVVLEAMKMEHALRSPHDGTVSEVRHHAGEQVEAGAVLVVVSE